MMFRRTMPLSSKVFAVLAVVLGSAAFLIVQAERERLAALSPAAGPLVPVVVARGPLPQGSTLASTALDSREMPQAFVPPGAFRSIDGLVGRILASDVAVGEVLTRTRLVTAGVGPLAGLVPGGMRAVAIAAPVPPGLRAGDRVDVLATFGGQGRVYTQTVGFALEVLRVIDPTGALGSAGERSPTLILLTSPEVAEQLATASAFATVQVTVIGPEIDPSFVETAPPGAPTSG